MDVWAYAIKYIQSLTDSSKICTQYHSRVDTSSDISPLGQQNKYLCF